MVEGIAATEIAKLVIALGVTATLLILFVMHFLRKDKDSDKKVTAAYEDCRRQIEATYRDAQEKIEAANRTIREREDMLIAQNAQREELLRQEAQRREELLRKESEKRESILMLNMDRISERMENMTKSLDVIKNGFAGVDRRLDKIEKKVGENR